MKQINKVVDFLKQYAAVNDATAIVELWNHFISDDDNDYYWIYNSVDDLQSYHKFDAVELSQKCVWGEVNFYHKWVCFDRWENITSFNFFHDKECPIDWEALVEWLIKYNSTELEKLGYK